MTDNKKSLDDRLDSLPTDVSPPPELWGRIEALLPADGAPVQTEEKLPGRATGSVWRGMYALAAAALFAAVTLGVVQLDSDGPATTQPIARVSALGTDVPTVELDGIDGLQLVAVRNDLHDALALALDELSPQTRTIVIENLAQIDAARGEIAKALKQEPNNTLLQQMLLASYTSEITLLGEFTAMAQSAQQRTRL